MKAKVQCEQCNKKALVELEVIDTILNKEDEGPDSERTILMDGTLDCDCGQELTIGVMGIAFSEHTPVNKWNVTDIIGCSFIDFQD